MKDRNPFNGKKIILFRTDRMGDLILSFSAVEALKAHLPEARIHIATHPSTAPLAEMQRNISRVVPCVQNGLKGLVTLIRFLRTQQYDAAVHLYPRPGLGLATFLAGIPVRVGTAYRYYSLLFNRKAKIHRKQMVMHERDLNLKLLGAMDVPFTRVPAGLCIPEAVREDIFNLLLAGGIKTVSDPFVVLHPGSGGSSLNWPEDQYGSLGNELVAMGYPVVLTGTETDHPKVSRVHAFMGERALNLCGRLDLKHLAALLDHAALTVSNSTGPLHLADALGKRVIGLYSPNFYSSPQRWGPYGQPENVFVPEGKLCYQCPRDRCREFNCMALIRPEKVLERAKELLCSAG